jgi:hypothetical protein
MALQTPEEEYNDEVYLEESLYRKCNKGEVFSNWDKIDNKLVKSIHDVVCDNLGFDLTNEQIQKFFDSESGKSVLHEVKEWGANDTECRSKICNLISKNLIGKPLPTYADSSSVAESYWKELHEAAKKSSIKITGT